MASSRDVYLKQMRHAYGLWHLAPTHLRLLFVTCEHETDDRGAAIVCAALVHDLLLKALAKAIGVASDPDRCTAHAAETKLRARGLLGENISKDLARLRQIRNVFAHRVDVETLDHPDVARLVDGLVIPTIEDICLSDPDKRRDVYTTTTAYLCDRLSAFLCGDEPTVRDFAPGDVEVDDDFDTITSA